MKFLIYGSKGWIGSQLVNYLSENNFNFVEGKSRVDNIENVKKEIKKVKPTHIFCLIGRTHGTIGDKVYGTIDYLEQPGKLKENIRDNLFSPLSLALLCNKNDIHLTYLGTGCIFKYNKTHLEGNLDTTFSEQDQPNFFDSSYSLVKGFTDRLMHLLPVCNLRIRMPIIDKHNPRNFITKIIKYEKICSVPNSMTVLDDFIPVMIQLSQNKFIGTINLTNPGVISHNEILDMYKEIIDPEFTWKNFTYDEQMEILASGRSNNHLDTTLLENMFEIDDIKTSVRKVLTRMKKNQNMET